MGGIGSALGGAIGNIGGALIGNAAASGNTDAQASDESAALASLQNVKDPDLQKIQLQQYVDQGVISPETAQAFTQQSSQLSNIKTDPALVQAQMQALQSLQQQGKTGLSPSDLAALNQIENQSNEQAQGQNQAILQNMQQRGQGGSGAELAAKLSSSQNAQNQAAQRGLTVAGQAQQNALNAIASSGQLGGQIQGQSFNQQAQQAAAQDAINRFNTQNQQQQANLNAQVANQAQYYNLGEKQQLANSNTGLQNQQTYYNQVQLPQQQYANKLQLAKAQANAYNNNAAYNQKQAQNIKQMWGGIGNAVGGVASAGLGGMGGGGGGMPSEYGTSEGQGASSDNSYDINPSTGGASGAGVGAYNVPRMFNGGVAGYANGGMVAEEVSNPHPAANIGDCYSNGGFIGQASELTPLISLLLQHGGKVPGEAEVEGDSPKNDTVPVKLSPGEVVIPRSHTHSKQAEKAFIDYLDAHKKYEAHHNGYNDGGSVVSHSDNIEHAKKFIDSLKKTIDGHKKKSKK